MLVGMPLGEGYMPYMKPYQVSNQPQNNLPTPLTPLLKKNKSSRSYVESLDVIFYIGLGKWRISNQRSRKVG